MERHQSSMKHRFFACVLAAVLAIGLSAVPALAAPNEDANASISIVSTDASSDEKGAAAEKAPAKEPAKSEPSSDASSAANSSSSEKKGESLSPLEKTGAILGAEGKVAASNATGIPAQSMTDEASDGEELDAKQQERMEIENAIMTMSTQGKTYYGDLSINKTFTAGPLYTVLNKDNRPVDSKYTVMFEVEGKDAKTGAPIYTKRTIGLTVDRENASNSITLDNLPEGEYTVREITYPGCNYKPTNGVYSQTRTLTRDNTGDNSLTFSFENEGTTTDAPSQGFVNHYRQYDNGFGWK